MQWKRPLLPLSVELVVATHASAEHCPDPSGEEKPAPQATQLPPALTTKVTRHPDQLDIPEV